MKNLTKLFSVVVLICIVTSAFAACNNTNGSTTTTDPNTSQIIKPLDFASTVKLDMSSNSLKQEVTVKSFIDGDTTHFYVPSSVSQTGVLKARFLAVNTPESTGKIEEYGKKASNFTKEKLSNATSIIIESDDGNWNLDSTGARHLVWIWYKTSQDSDYRNLNIEILQNGLAIASNSGNNRYGSTCLEAIAQAKAQKLNVYSGQPDPDFFYGEAVELTLKELRCNIETYNGMKVAFEGIVTRDYNDGVYIEEYDAETDMYYGMYIYYGYNLSGDGLEILSFGNEVRVVGTVSFYETGGTYQVSGVQYRLMKPNDPDNLKLISEGNFPAYVLTDADTFKNSRVDIEKIDPDTEESTIVTFDYANLAMATSIQMNNLKVKSVYTTTGDDSSSKGAMTLTCMVDGVEIDVRTVVLYDEDRNIITADYFEGKTIDVTGIVDYFSGEYQIKIFSVKDVTIHN